MYSDLSSNMFMNVFKPYNYESSGAADEGGNTENEHYFKSPLQMKPSMEQRFCFTESKIPFKNATNDTNLPQSQTQSSLI